VVQYYSSVCKNDGSTRFCERHAFFRKLAFRSKQQFVLARTQTFWPEVAICAQVYPRFSFSLTLEARCGHFWRILNFSVSCFRCFCNLLRHTSWLFFILLDFLTYGKVFTAIGIFLLELLATEYFTHLPRSLERSKMTCACSGGYVSWKR